MEEGKFLGISYTYDLNDNGQFNEKNSSYELQIICQF